MGEEWKKFFLMLYIHWKQGWFTYIYKKTDNILEDIFVSSKILIYPLTHYDWLASWVRVLTQWCAD